MDNTPTTRNTDLINKAAELAFSDFLKQVTKSNSKGFISEANGQKIFSFETYLRETGSSEDRIQTYCSHIKSIEDTAAKSRLYRLIDYRTWIKALLITLVPGVVLYLLVTAFLWTFGISFLKLVPFILFALSCPFFYSLLYLRQYLQLKKARKSGITRQQYIIKYFDNDELTFVKAKSRLFVEN